MKIKNYLSLIIVVTIPFMANSQDYCGFILQTQAYQNSVKLKYQDKYHIIDSNTFKIDTYLKFFNSVDIQKNYRIGLFYYDHFVGGYPLLYAVKAKKEIENKDTYSLYKLVQKNKYRAKNHMIPNDTEVGFLQYLFFSEMGEQFALKWHSYYGEKYIICSHDQLINVVDNLSKSEDFYADLEDLKKIRDINPQIVIQKTKANYSITWIVNRTHFGIYRCTYEIKRSKPFKITKIKEEKLLKIETNLVY